MNKIFKPVILLIIPFFLLQNSFCQGQKDMPDYLRQRFLQYTKAVPREEIYIHSDRDVYIAGENMFFNIYLTDRQNSAHSKNSRIAYFELLNTANRPVVQKRILLDKGSGPGQIVIPDSLSSGTYTIRAYTNWMKNFLPENCFMKDIQIYNAMSNKAFRLKTNVAEKPVNPANSSGLIENVNRGISVKVNNLNTDTLELIVGSDNKFRTQNNNLIYLFIQTHGQINRISSEHIISDITTIYVSKSELIKGINHITLFDAKGQPVLERFIYTPDKKMDLMKAVFPDSIKLRSRISIDVEIPSFLLDSVSSSKISVSVAPLTGESAFGCIDDYMDYGTEFGSQIFNQLKGRSFGSLPPVVADSLLSDIKSSWIDWSEILSDKRPYFKYKMEKKDHFLSGKLLTQNRSTVDSVDYILLSTPGKEPGFQYAKTDNEGNFNFTLNIDGSLKDLIIMSDDVKKSDKLRIESSFSDKYLSSVVSTATISKTNPTFVQDWSANYQINKIYKISSSGPAVDLHLEPLKPVRFYSKPDIELILAEYISLPTMEEIFYELLPRVFLRKNKSGYEISIADRVEDNKFVMSPSILLDGVVINNAAVIAGLDPVNVEKIDVIKDKYMVGNYPFYGIVNVITKAHDFSIIPLPEYMTRLPYRVIDPVLNFVSPDYSEEGNSKIRIPDFRNTLYWDPSVPVSKAGKATIEFWSADIPTEYLITIQGITPGRKFISLKKHVRVIPQ
jgi:hypothetical protein